MEVLYLNLFADICHWNPEDSVLCNKFLFPSRPLCPRLSDSPNFEDRILQNGRDLFFLPCIGSSTTGFDDDDDIIKKRFKEVLISQSQRPPSTHSGKQTISIPEVSKHGKRPSPIRGFN